MPYYWKIPFADPDGNSFEARVLNPNGAADMLLHGSIHPLTVEEDTDDFMHRPIRKQSGYLGIVDTGSDIGGQEQFDWTDLFPATVTDRLVELWNVDDEEMVWWGFLKPETFSGKLNTLPQERKLPLVGPLDVLEAFDFAPATTGLINLGGVLDYIISQVPELCDDVHITEITFQGIDAVDDSTEGWLYQRLSPSLFYDTDDDGTLTPKYNCLDVLEKVCQFLGLTARTQGKSLWFVAPTDAIASSLTPWSVIRVQDLATIAQGNAPTHIDIQWTDATLTGSPFASTSNEETFIPGVKKVTVEEDVDSIDSVVELPMDEVEKDSTKSSTSGAKIWGESITQATYNTNGRRYRRFVETHTQNPSQGVYQKVFGFDLNTITLPLYGDPQSELYSFARLVTEDYDDEAYDGSTLLKHTFNWMARFRTYFNDLGNYPAAIIEQNNNVALADGVLVLDISTQVDVIRNNQHYTYNGYGALKVSIQVGDKYWNPTSSTWTTTATTFDLIVGGTETAQGSGRISNNRELFGPYPPYNGYGMPVDRVAGKMRITIYSATLYNANQVTGGTAADAWIDITDLSLTFMRGDNLENWSSNDKNTYTATNTGCTGEIKVDNIMTTDRNNAPGNGLLFGTSGEYCQWLPYDGQQDAPGDRVARTIAAYYSRPRRKLSLELRRHLVSLTPGTRVIYNGTDYYPISISNDWYDDVQSVILLEL